MRGTGCVTPNRTSASSGKRSPTILQYSLAACQSKASRHPQQLCCVSLSWAAIWLQSKQGVRTAQKQRRGQRLPLGGGCLVLGLAQRTSRAAPRKEGTSTMQDQPFRSAVARVSLSGSVGCQRGGMPQRHNTWRKEHAPRRAAAAYARTDTRTSEGWPPAGGEISPASRLSQGLGAPRTPTPVLNASFCTASAASGELSSRTTVGTSIASVELIEKNACPSMALSSQPGRWWRACSAARRLSVCITRIILLLQ